ncbi:cytochrome P450 monooxygenase [Aspergillus keveii]|uniref:Cytochrome P450 monooxygenase n=1 Tax=Aspergillus keveii TaxID=714993 RepID=A0ABR4GEG7_9EURO
MDILNNHDNLRTYFPLGTTITTLILLLLLFLYLSLLPARIPGIPSNSSLGTLGDLPSLLSHFQKTGETASWFALQNKAHASPLVQVFLRPFTLKQTPFLLLADFRESRDILTRRGREFDRSSFVADLMGGAVPGHHIVLRTGGAWKRQRRLLQDLMGPKFLGDVAAPRVYGCAIDLVRVWRGKVRLGGGRAFSAREDMMYATVDAILKFSFGDAFVHSTLEAQMGMLQGLDCEETVRLNSVPVQGRGKQGASELDEDTAPAVFGEAPIHPSVRALLNAASIIEELQRSAVPKLTYWWISRKKGYREAQRLKDGYIRDHIARAVRSLEDSDRDEKPGSQFQSAVDLMVAREKQLAQQEGREPDYFSRIMSDEIFGFVVGGHDTTSTTLLWGLKLLTANPEAQSRLRACLQSAHAQAVKERRPPSIKEITHTPIAYFDAVIEEILRCGNTSPIITREATVDTLVLGYPVPKGTNVFMLSNGASFFAPSFDINESARSKTSQASRARKFDESGDMAAFLPERWLVPGSACGANDGAWGFDAMAVPQLVFGLGTRGCYGRRFAYLEMRVLVTLIVWHFELLGVPEGLASWAAVDGLSHQPRECFVRLREIEY